MLCVSEKPSGQTACTVKRDGAGGTARHGRHGRLVAVGGDGRVVAGDRIRLRADARDGGVDRHRFRGLAVADRPVHDVDAVGADRVAAEHRVMRPCGRREAQHRRAGQAGDERDTTSSTPSDCDYSSHDVSHSPTPRTTDKRSRSVTKARPENGDPHGVRPRAGAGCGRARRPTRGRERRSARLQTGLPRRACTSCCDHGSRAHPRCCSPSTGPIRSRARAHVCLNPAATAATPESPFTAAGVGWHGDPSPQFVVGVTFGRGADLAPLVVTPTRHGAGPQSRARVIFATRGSRSRR